MKKLKTIFRKVYFRLFRSETGLRIGASIAGIHFVHEVIYLTNELHRIILASVGLFIA